jgi:hypothetical protein
MFIRGLITVVYAASQAEVGRKMLEGYRVRISMRAERKLVKIV